MNNKLITILLKLTKTKIFKILVLPFTLLIFTNVGRISNQIINYFIFFIFWNVLYVISLIFNLGTFSTNETIIIFPILLLMLFKSVNHLVRLKGYFLLSGISFVIFPAYPFWNFIILGSFFIFHCILNLVNKKKMEV